MARKKKITMEELGEAMSKLDEAREGVLAVVDSMDHTSELDPKELRDVCRNLTGIARDCSNVALRLFSQIELREQRIMIDQMQHQKKTKE